MSQFNGFYTLDMLFFVLFGFFSFSEGIQVTPEPVFSQPPYIPPKYRTNEELGKRLSELSENFTEITSFYSLGKTVEGRDIWVFKIKVPNSPILGAPSVKFVGNIHGNEPVGRELLVYLAEYLTKNYETDSEVKWILDRTVVYLVPSLNPDGFTKSREGDCYSGPGRENGNLVDLNRSFPDQFRDNRTPVQPETLAIVRWLTDNTFVLSASFHGGALVANYPFDSIPAVEKDTITSRTSLTPDDDVFKHLAQTYSNNHLTMHKGRTCHETQPSFPGGITNGAAWYTFAGGMQDYNYVSHGCMELTLEISCCKYPQAGHLPRLWMENKKAMLELIKQSHTGVRGLIVDKITSTYIPGAVLYISGRNIPFRSSKNGEFWRILLPGDYILVVNAKGYVPQTFPFTVGNLNSTHPTSTWLNIYLQPTDDLLASASNMVTVASSAVTFTSFPIWILLLLSKLS